MRCFIPISAAVLLAGCQTFPEKHAVDNQRTYPMTRDAVWSDVMAWVQSQPLQVGKADAAAGVILASAVYPGSNGGDADCGEDSSSPAIERRQQVAIQVTPVEGGGTMVNIQSTVKEDRRSGWDLSTITIDCQSRGGFEASLLDAIN